MKNRLSEIKIKRRQNCGRRSSIRTSQQALTDRQQLAVAQDQIDQKEQI